MPPARLNDKNARRGAGARVGCKQRADSGEWHGKARPWHTGGTVVCPVTLP